MIGQMPPLFERQRLRLAGMGVLDVNAVKAQQRKTDRECARWSPAGAVCVHHPRIVDNLTLAELARNCPRLAAATLGEDCDAAGAAQQGALLFNRSVDHRGAWPTGP